MTNKFDTLYENLIETYTPDLIKMVDYINKRENLKGINAVDLKETEKYLTEISNSNVYSIMNIVENARLALPSSL